MVIMFLTGMPEVRWNEARSKTEFLIQGQFLSFLHCFRKKKKEERKVRNKKPLFLPSVLVIQREPSSGNLQYIILWSRFVLVG